MFPVVIHSEVGNEYVISYGADSRTYKVVKEAVGFDNKCLPKRYADNVAGAGHIETYAKYATAMIDTIKEIDNAEGVYTELFTKLEQTVPSSGVVAVKVTSPGLRSVRDEDTQVMLATDHSIADTEITTLGGTEVLELVQEVINIKGTHKTLHELLYAGASEFIKMYPSSKLATTVNDTLSKVNRSGKSPLDNNCMVYLCWKTDVNKFMLEALCNPRMITALDKLGLHTELVEVVTSAMGIERDGKLMKYITNGYAAMIEYQSSAPESLPGGFRVALTEECKSKLMKALSALKDHTNDM